MRLCAWIVWGCVLIARPSFAAADDAPATAPAGFLVAPDPALVAPLIRKLDDPMFRKRQEAAAELIALGPGVLPQLEQAQSSVSFEARAAIQQILVTLRDLLRGVIVYRVVPNSQATRLGIAPGDIIVRLDGQTVTDNETYTQLSFMSEDGRRRLLIRSGGELREVTVSRGQIGVYLADYDERYGPPLVSAIRAFGQDRMPEARDAFQQAHAAGLKLTEADQLPAMYALATYFAGDAPAARGLLNEWAESSHNGSLWPTLEETLAGLHRNAAHLGLHIVRERARRQADNLSLSLALADRLCALNQQPEGIVGVLGALQHEPRILDAFSETQAWGLLLSELESLDLRHEALQLIPRVDSPEARPAMRIQAAEVAARLGHQDLASGIRLAIAENWLLGGQFEPDAWGPAIEAALSAGHEAEALTALQSLRPEHAARLLTRLSPSHFRWAQARAVMGELARPALETEEANDLALARAFDALLRETDPDAAELDGVYHRYLQARIGTGAERAPALLDACDHAQIALLRGNLTEARRLAAGPAPGTPMAAEAVRFVLDQGPTLTGDAARWRQTRWVWSLPDGRRLLLTRDDRLAVVSADGRSLSEVPPPDQRWHTPAGVPGVFLSPKRGRPLTVSNDTLHALSAGGDAWMPVLKMPLGWGRNILDLAGVLDELIETIESTGASPAVAVWPPVLEVPAGGVWSLMLEGGDWMACDLRAGKVWLPRAVAERAIGRPVEIYEILPPGPGRRHAYLLSSQGLLEWSPGGQVRRIALPDETAPLPVVSSDEGVPLPAGWLRVALLPQHGGTTYRLDTAAGALAREGCVNEFCPPTFWKQMPLQAKRRLLAEALAEAGVSAPWSATQPATP